MGSEGCNVLCCSCVQADGCFPLQQDLRNQMMLCTNRMWWWDGGDNPCLLESRMLLPALQVSAGLRGSGQPSATFLWESKDLFHF